MSQRSDSTSPCTHFAHSFSRSRPETAETQIVTASQSFRRISHLELFRKFCLPLGDLWDEAAWFRALGESSCLSNVQVLKTIVGVASCNSNVRTEWMRSRPFHEADLWSVAVYLARSKYMVIPEGWETCHYFSRFCFPTNSVDNCLLPHILLLQEDVLKELKLR